ncbi:MAG: hypothetical protein JKY37_33985, partial [Nannocystaceae bacterium]|nr:hypothetical protein [Nannocystaceae bacterium]
MTRTAFVFAALVLGCDTVGTGDAEQKVAEPTPSSETPTPSADAATVDAPTNDTPAGDSPITAAMAPSIERARKPVGVVPPVGPVELSAPRINAVESDDDPIELEMTLDAKVHQQVRRGTELWAQVQCETGGLVYSESSALAAVSSGSLEAVVAGDSILVHNTFSNLRLAAKGSRCNLRFALASSSGDGPIVELTQACWDGGSVATLGACSPALALAPASGFTSDFDVISLGVAENSMFSGLDLRYAVRVNDSVKDKGDLVFKVACEVGDKTLVETSEERWPSGAYLPGAGELVAGEVSLFWGVDGVDSRPEHCELTVSLARGTMFSKRRPLLLHEACLDGTTVKAGACDPSRAAAVTAKPASSSSLKFDGLAVAFAESSMSPGKFSVEFKFDATV